MKKFILLPIFCIAILGSCKNKDSKDLNKTDDARMLFQKSTELIIDFTTKLKNAQDSAQIDSLIKTFDKTLTDLNFSFPPNTDLQLTEQENDSLFHLLSIYKSERDLKLNPVKISEPDSVAPSMP